MRDLKDYVVYVADLAHFKTHLLQNEPTVEFISGETLEDILINVAKTLTSNSTGSTVSISRADPEQYDYFNDCAECKIIGEAKEQYITTADDINFYTQADRALYYSVYGAEPVTYVDEEGKIYEATPSELHGVLASKSLNYT